jgi:tryptophanyl-tRNA synthetase
MKKETILSGIQATGALHIGNYLGALKQFVELQNSGAAECYFFIADLHSLTVPFEPATLRANTLEAAAEYLAAGIDPDKSTLFIQSQVPEHAELAWIFSCITPLGELERMTQYKDKGTLHNQSLNAGLLTYPTLMASDILLYKPTSVPVGEDQIQHLELTRIIARKFNNKFGETFPEPKSNVQKPLRIKSLSHPERKMSKTGDEALLISDEPAEIERKLKKAVTASEGTTSPGVENLMQILGFFAPAAEVKQFEASVLDGSIKYSELKMALASHIGAYFAEFREKKKALLANPKQLQEILAEGAKKAHATAGATMAEVKEKIGLL